MIWYRRWPCSNSSRDRVALPPTAFLMPPRRRTPANLEPLLTRPRPRSEPRPNGQHQVRRLHRPGLYLTAPPKRAVMTGKVFKATSKAHGHSSPQSNTGQIAILVG